MTLDDLPTPPMTLAAVAAARVGPISTGRTRKQRKGVKDRAEDKQKRITRAACVDRDGYCRVETAVYGFADEPVDGDVLPDLREAHLCDGPSQWAHRGEKRRARTRGQAPEMRHTAAGSLMLCQRHHDQYDNKQKPRLFITALTSKGADGPLKFRRGPAK